MQPPLLLLKFTDYTLYSLVKRRVKTLHRSLQLISLSLIAKKLTKNRRFYFCFVKLVLMPFPLKYTLCDLYCTLNLVAHPLSRDLGNNYLPYINSQCRASEETAGALRCVRGKGQRSYFPLVIEKKGLGKQSSEYKRDTKKENH